MMPPSVDHDAQIQSLPIELLENVLMRIHAPELKALRRTSKFFEKLSTPRLYANFTLYPHVRSFERLLNIAECEKLRSHVRRLNYDTGYLSLTGRFLQRIQTVWSNEISADEKQSAIEHARIIDSQKINANLSMDNMVQLNYLERAFAKLANLRDIEVQDSCEHLNEGFTQEQMPSFYAQLAEETCGRHSHTILERGKLGVYHVARATYAHAVMIAASKLSRPLRKLCLNGLNWPHLLQQGTYSKFQLLFERSMAGLKTLNLSAEAGGYFPNTWVVANLQTLLRAVGNLEELTLANRGCDDTQLCGLDLMENDIGTTCSSMFQPRPGEHDPLPLPAQLVWSPRLRHLDLHGIILSAKEFKNVLKPCCETLEFFSFANIMLMPEDFSVVRSKEIPRACWVSMLKWMQRHLKTLQSINIHGRLTNGGMQHWWVAPTSTAEGSLKMRMYSFMLQGGPCPLDHLAIKSGDFDLEKKTWNEAVPELLDTLEYGGDETWATEYYDESDIEPALDDNDAFSDLEVDTDTDDDGWDDHLFFPSAFSGLFPQSSLLAPPPGLT